MAGRPDFLQPLLRRAAGPMAARNRRTGRLVAVTLETAFESAARRKGLLGRDGLAAGHALVIAPCALVHTFRMRFAIDILFAARDGRVLDVRHGLPPWRIAGALGAFAVLELAAGEIEGSGSGTVPGDALEIVAP